jgi:hypothetical protein
MRINIHEIKKFLENYQNSRRMPESIRYLMMIDHHIIEYDGSKMFLVEARMLDPEILQSQQFPTGKCSVPILYLGEGNYIAFNPYTGKRLGKPQKIYNTQINSNSLY